MPPALVARASQRHRFAGWWARPLAWFGMLVLAAMMLIGPLWTLVFGAFLVLGPVSWSRARRTRWEVDEPGRARMRGSGGASTRAAPCASPTSAASSSS